MKTLTVETKESLSQEKQRELHSILRMEFYTDYIFSDMESSQYSATISMENIDDVINNIIKNSKKAPDYTIILEILDTKDETSEEVVVKNGEILSQ